MKALRENQLKACLDSITDHIERIRQLDLTVETDLQLALERSQEVLGALAMYRGLLQSAGSPGAWPHRRAA